MNRAAAELHTVHSNVAARIRALETALGCKLFDRHSRGVALTQSGERLLPYARRVAWLLADAARATRDDGQPRGPLTIGSLETTAALRLPPLFARFAADCPEVDLAIRPGTTAEPIEAVLERRLEGAFVCGPVAHPSLIERVMFQEELAILAAPGVVSIQAATKGGFARIVVLRAGCSYRQRLESLLARRGVAVPRLMEFGTLEAIFGSVSAGLGITLLPHALIGPVWQTGRVSLHPLTARGRDGRHRVHSPARGAFIQCLPVFVDRAQQTRDLGATGSVDCRPVLALPLGSSLDESPANPAYCLGIATKIGNAGGERGSRRT